MKAIIEVSRRGSVFRTAAQQLQGARKRRAAADFRLSFESARSLFAEQYTSTHQNGHSDLSSLETCTRLIGGHFCFDQQQGGGNTLAVWLPCGRN